MRKWTSEERARQAEKIRQWQPWKKAGVKTAAGKARSSKNAYKHGGFTEEIFCLRDYLRDVSNMLRLLKQQKGETIGANLMAPRLKTPAELRKVKRSKQIAEGASN